MTDDCGLFQHAVLTLPNFAEGYTTDDNARGLIALVLAEGSSFDDVEGLMELEARYLSFLIYAFDSDKGHFRNFLGYDRLWKEDVGSEDSNGRALWSLGMMSARTQFENLKGSASTLFTNGLPQVDDFSNLRSWAFTLLGLDEYLKHFPGDRAAQISRKNLSDRLVNLYRQNSSPDWHWFEDILTYSNARIAQAVILAGEGQDDSEMVGVGLEALEWLCRQQSSESGLFAPIGSNGWFRRGEEKARFDQQPVEASATVSASLAAYRITGDDAWLQEAWRAFHWFMGANELGIPLYDPNTGGCQDGLQPDRVNKNQGAESTLSFLIALLEMDALVASNEGDGKGIGHIIPLPVRQTLSGD